MWALWMVANGEDWLVESMPHQLLVGSLSAELSNIGTIVDVWLILLKVGSLIDQGDETLETGMNFVSRLFLDNDCTGLGTEESNSEDGGNGLEVN